MQSTSLIYLVGATFQGIGYQPVMLMIVGLQIALYSYVKRLESAKAALSLEEALSPREKRRRVLQEKSGGNQQAPGAVTA